MLSHIILRSSGNVSAPQPPIGPPVGTGPARLSRSGSKLRASGQDVRLSGANAYWLALNDNVRDSNNNPTLPSKAIIDSTLDEIKAMGANTVRIHTLGISIGKPGTMQPTLGNWDAAAVDQADYVVAAARARKLWLIVPLVDRWDYYHGGALSYCRLRGLSQTQSTFLTNSQIRTDFKATITYLLNHVNPYTNIRWGDDPTLAIWQLANEFYDATQEWHDDIAAHINSLSSSSLIMDGTGASGRHIKATTGFNGTDAPGVSNVNTDIVSTHFYNAQRKDITWLNKDASDAVDAGKVYLTDEYDWCDGVNNNVDNNGGATRAQWLTALESNPDVSGDLMWTIIHSSAGQHRDGYELYVPNQENVEQQHGYEEFSSHYRTMIQFKPIGTYRPSVSTAGVPPGTALTRVNGDTVITTNNTVIENKEYYGQLRIKADNVTVRRCKIRGRDYGPNYTQPILMALPTDQTGVVFEDCTVYADYPVVGMNGIQVGGGATVTRCDVSNVTDTMVTYDDDCIVKANYLHDNIHYAYDPAHSDGSHDDGIQIEGGARNWIVGNSITGAYNSGIQVTQNYKTNTDLTIDRNWIGDGNLSLNTSEKGKGAYVRFRVTNNRFDRTSRSGVAGVITATTKAVAVISGNVYSDNGAPVSFGNAGS